MGLFKKKQCHFIEFVLFGESFKRSFKTKQKAEFFLRCLDASSAQITPITVAEGFKKYLETESIKKKQSSYKLDERALNSLLGFLKSNDVQMLLEVQIIHIEKYQSEQSLVRKGSTVNRNFNTIKHTFKKLHQWGYLSVSPCVHIRSLQEDKKEITLWEPRQYERLKRAFSSPQDRLILTLLWETGARISSIIKMKKKDVNLSQRYISLSSQKGPYRNSKLYKAPISNDLHTQMRTFINKMSESESLFKLSTGKEYKASNYSKKIQRTLKKAKMSDENLILHGIRHTFATRLSEQNIPIKTISKLMGHSNTSITEAYIHSNLDSLRNHLK